ncbi:lipid IV(A) 3-deoxy-D-manno-octulosonic acid transferase [Vibrio rarus]|uniref:lipid IV(A) 3-deoxy-D-manno-octulosonic acid transferase n=1 Tax=Vibrio rarus TaxID=413403 RepID=UPI0021C48A2E|nr:lipid IV(A) 3-deoxy-D-manno-octulosonic acid transferase [Vibrio rarus]
MKKFLIIATYTVILTILSPILLVVLLRKKLGKPSIGQRWGEYFGVTPPLNGTRPIWIHTVSVGETIAATPLIRAIKQKYPNQDILITTTTTTGAEQAEKIADIAEHRFMPIDFSWCITRFLKQVNPKCMLIMETELWPNTLRTVCNAGVPITVINARLSERSCQRYLKFHSVFKLMANHIHQVLCQHTDDEKRFTQLGLTSDKVHVTGSLKFDISTPENIALQGHDLRIKLGQNRPIWIAASTHDGEDEIIYNAHQKLLQHCPSALLILVPRHPERFNKVAKQGTDKGFNVIQRTAGAEVKAATQVYLGDTMGEMLTLISAADICFMGGSLIGDKVGGHNMLEPAALEKPILNGPSYFNFKDITQQLIKEKALIICPSDEDISSQLIHLFDDSTRRMQMGENAYQVVKRNQGAVNKTIQALGAVISTE